jgi:hypothetical protein
MMKASNFSQVVLGVFKLCVKSFDKVMNGNDAVVSSLKQCENVTLTITISDLTY